MLFGLNGYCDGFCGVCCGVAVDCHNTVAVSLALDGTAVGQLQAGGTAGLQQFAVGIVDVDGVLNSACHLSPGDNRLTLAVQRNLSGGSCQISGAVLCRRER